MPPRMERTTPSSAPSSRPPIQTLRQARKQYQRSTNTCNLSAVELRRLERAAELQARADAIKEKERRRKQNRERRERRLHREKAAAGRRDSAARGDENKGDGGDDGDEAGPLMVPRSQEVLGTFWGPGKKRGGRAATLATDSTVEGAEGSEQRAGRGALTDLSTNVFNAALTAPPSPTCERSVAQSTPSISQHHFLPPSQPASSMRQQLALPESDHGEEAGDWDSLFPSNTQVQRELSQDVSAARSARISPPPRPPPSHPPSRPAPAQPIRLSPRNECDDLEEVLSTQDLEVTHADLAEIKACTRTRQSSPDQSLGPPPLLDKEDVSQRKHENDGEREREKWDESSNVDEEVLRLL
ncbi:MAG: hypothetical protein M1838_000166 [Thelocarpon superellum]|nr:MAG: hypothetical protein M1838_000166 [Thelocarpon superellum]